MGVAQRKVLNRKRILFPDSLFLSVQSWTRAFVEHGRKGLRGHGCSHPKDWIHGWRFLALLALMFEVLAGSADCIAADQVLVTNIAQFRELEVEIASSNAPIRLQATVTYADLPWNQVFLQDETGGMQLTSAGITNEPVSGDLVELTGRTSVEEQRVIVAQPSLRLLGRKPLLQPQRASVPEMLEGRWPAQRIEISGIVRRSEIQDGRLRLIMLAGTTRFTAYVRQIPRAEFDPSLLYGRKIVAQGVCAHRFQGNRIEDVTLYVAGMAHIIPITEALIGDAKTPVLPIQRVLEENPQMDAEVFPVRIQGVVVRKRSANVSNLASVVLQDPSGSIQVVLYERQPVSINDRLDVQGFPALLNQEIVLQDTVYSVHLAKPPASEPVSTSPFAVESKPELMDIRSIRSLTKAQASQRLRVRIQGVVTWASAIDQTLFMKDETGAIYVRSWQEGLRAGHLVEVQGITDPGGVARMVADATVRIIGQSNLPVPSRIDLRDLASEAFDCAWVELEGVVRSMDPLPVAVLRLSSDQGDFTATVLPVGKAIPESLLIDSRVRLRGVSTPVPNNRDQLIGVLLRLPNWESIEVLRPAPADPFAIEIRPASAVQHGVLALLGLHRIRLQGMVTLVGADQEFHLQDASGGIRIVTVQTNAIAAGDTVEVAGFPRITPRSSFLEEAIFRHVRGPWKIEPRPVRSEDILPQGRYDQELVVLEGMLLGDAGGSTLPSLLVQSGTVVFRAQFDTANRAKTAPVWRANSLVRLTGVCAVQWGERNVPRSFVLQMRDPSDVVVLQRPPWWSWRHAMLLGAVLLALVLASFGWVGFLKRKVRLQTEQVRLRFESEAGLQIRFALVWETSADGMRMTDAEGTTVQVNEAYCRMVQKSREELERHSLAIVYKAGDRQRILEAYKSRFAHEDISARQETRLALWNGRDIWFEVSNTFFNQPGQPRLVLSQFRDVTDRKRAEEEKAKLQAQLLQAQKMESVGRLAGGVAHDFNNMLQVILGNVALALEHATPGSQLSEDLHEIQNSAQRSADLTRQLLAFARKQTVNPRVLDLNDTVEGMLKMLHRLIGEHIHLSWNPGNGLWPVKIDPAQIDQILANLTVNARDAIATEGKVIIETRNMALDDAFAQTHPDCQPGEYVMLAVSDTGKGMDPAAKGHLFEPFFTTKELGKGTGLGLATVFGIVKQNFGLIDVYSEVGHGTTVKIYLPRSESPATPVMAAEQSLSLRGSETVLLVEDEEQILTLGQRILAQQGYQVLMARGPKEAIKLASEHSGPIQLLVTDVVMPTMNGKELMSRIQELQPGIKCLFMSGYTADLIAHHGVLAEGIQFIQKPFTISTLAEKVRHVLEQPSEPARESITPPSC